MKYLIMLLVFVMLLFGLNAIKGQESKRECNIETIVKSAASLDKTKLSKFANLISEANTACNGFEYSGRGHKIIGPIELPDGTWKLTLHSKDVNMWTGNALDGDCGHDSYSSHVFSETIVDSKDAAMQIVPALKNCKLLVELYVMDEEWRITVEPFKP